MKTVNLKKGRIAATVLCLMLFTYPSFFTAAGAEQTKENEQEQDYVFDNVVVTATRTSVNEFKVNANINVITQKDIELNHFRDLTEALRSVPGVSIARYGIGSGYEQSEAIAINGSTKILVLIDGTRANMNGSVSNVFSFGAFKNLDNVERIEILKGSASTLYGSDAKGGVINIITKKGSKVNEASTTTIGAQIGSYDTQQYRIFHQGRSGKFGYVVSAQKDKSGWFKDANGLSIPTYLDATTLNLKINADLNEKSDLTIAYDRYIADYMYSGTNLNHANHRYGTANNYNWRAIYNYNFNDNIKNQLSVYSQNTNTLYDTWLMDLQTIGFTEQLTAKLSKNNELVAGIEYYEEKIKDYNDSYDAYKGKKISNKAFFIQDTWDITDAFNLTGGLRYNNHSMAGNNTSLSAVAGYNISSKTNIYTGFKEYFVAPSQYHYFSPYGNENIKPESGHTYEFGINHKFDDTFSLKISAFNRKAKDVIVFAYGFPVTPSNPYGGAYINLDKESSDGWDIQLNKIFNKNFRSLVGYTHTKVKSQPASGGTNIDRNVPNGEWHIGLTYNENKFEASLLGRGIIGRLGPETGKPGYSAFPCDTYWVWDMSLNYNYKPNTRFYFKINNMFNQFYAEYSNVRYGQPGEWYTSPGRNFQAGVAYTF